MQPAAGMFKKIVSEALGLSDIGIIVPPSDYDKVDADDYLFDEDNEKIFFLIKSKKDEYCFTNLALIHVDGDSAVSSKRSIRRYEYSSRMIGEVTIETAGTLDMDIELKFTIGETAFSIDIRKNFIDQLKDIYKALITIGRMQRRDEASRDNALRCLDVIGSMYKIGQISSEDQVTKQYTELLTTLNTALLDKHKRRDFSPVFDRYIQK